MPGGLSPEERRRLYITQRSIEDYRARIATHDAGDEAAIAEGKYSQIGIVPLTFYSPTNAAGQMLRSAAALAVLLPYRGSIVALAFQASVACQGTYTVYINGTATSASLTVSGDTSEYKVWVPGTYGFVEGALVQVTASGVATSAVVEVTVFAVQDPTTVI